MENQNRKITITAALGLVLVLGIVIGNEIRKGDVSAQTSTVVPTRQVTQAQPSPKSTQPAPKVGGHTANGITEQVLTGSNAEKARAAALKAVPGGAIQILETDAEGDVYEAHMTKADGTSVTVKFDRNFNVTRIEEGYGGKTGGRIQ